MSEANVSEMPQDYWAWLDTGKLKPLGTCDGYDEAFEKADALPHNNHWVFSRAGLEEFKAEVDRELGPQLRVVAAVFEHRHGTDVRVFRTEEQAYAWRTQIAQDWWDGEFPDDERPADDVIGEVYFEKMTVRTWGDEEYFSIHPALLEGD